MSLSDNEILELLTADGVDTGKFWLGKTCPRKHTYKDTDMNLRQLDSQFMTRNCHECMKEKLKDKQERLRKKQWCEDNREKEKIRKRQWDKDHPEARKRWNIANVEKLREYRRRYYAKKKAEKLAASKQSETNEATLSNRPPN